jgi:NADH-quinone oxidoreductase subunit N
MCGRCCRSCSCSARRAHLLIDLFIKPTQRDVTHWFRCSRSPSRAGWSGWRAGAGRNHLRVQRHVPARRHVDRAELFILLLTGAVFLYGRVYLRDHQCTSASSTCCCCSPLGMMLLVSAGNMITVYLGLELLTLSSTHWSH